MLDASLQGGVVVCQHWQLRRGLGSSPGQAWEAEDLRSGGSVAIRFLRGPQSLDEPARQRFEREARAFARVRSPHYVQILDHGVSEHGVPFLVTERLDGEDLGVLLARQPRLSLAEAGLILDQLLRGLARLQSLRLVHRDIKPENVFLIDAGEGRRLVKLLDFGFASRPGRHATSLATQAAWQDGAPYWSPEQLAAPARVDQRTDVWAVGVLGYQMLTGQLPFPADDQPTLLQRVQVGKFAPLSAVRPELPVALDGWFQEMLHPELLARFAGAEPARLVLEQILRAARAARRGPPPLPRSAPPPSQPAPSELALAKRADSPAVLAQVVTESSPAEICHAVIVEREPEPAEQSSAAVTDPPAEQSSRAVADAPAEQSSAVVTDPPAEQSSRAVVDAPAEQSSPAPTTAPSRVVTSRVPVAEQGVRVGTLLVCGLLLVSLLAGLLALRTGRTSGLRSQAAAAESAREPPQPSAAKAPARVETPAPPAPLQLSAAAAVSAEPTVQPPAPAEAPLLSTPVAAERLRSRSAGARLSPGPAAVPVMEGGPRDKRSRKPVPAAQPAAPERAADPPPPASSAPPPAASRPYRGF